LLRINSLLLMKQ